MKPNNMIPEFIELAHGKKELIDWFQLAHCSDCGQFTLQPYFLGCHTNHIFCERCVAANLVTHGDRCAKCSHKISKIDGTTFYAHANALLNLLHVKMPETAMNLEHEYTHKLASSTRDTKSGEIFLSGLLNLTIEQLQDVKSHDRIDLSSKRKPISMRPN